MTDADRAEIVQQIARHQTRLRAFLRCLLANKSDSDDLLQDVNLTLWEKADQFRIGTDFWAWASQIARYKALNEGRKARHRLLVTDTALLARLADLAQEKLRQVEPRREALDHCLQQLPAGQRQLLELRYGTDHDIAAIAAAIGRSAASVRQTLFRIRNALLACVERRLAAEGGVT